MQVGAEFAPQEVANTLWALARIGAKPSAPVMAEFFIATDRRLSSFKPHELSSMAWALAKVREQVPWAGQGTVEAAIKMSSSSVGPLLSRPCSQPSCRPSVGVLLPFQGCKYVPTATLLHQGCHSLAILCPCMLVAAACRGPIDSGMLPSTFLVCVQRVAISQVHWHAGAYAAPLHEIF